MRFLKSINNFLDGSGCIFFGYNFYSRGICPLPVYSCSAILFSEHMVFKSVLALRWYPHSTTPPLSPNLWHPSARLISWEGMFEPALDPTICLLGPSPSSCVLTPSWGLRSTCTSIWNTNIYSWWCGEKTKTLEKSKKSPEYSLILQWFAAQGLSHPEVFPRERTRISVTAGHSRENLAPKHSNPSWKAPLLLVLFG